MVTSLEKLKEIASKEYELPPFIDGTPFVARLKSVSTMDMAKDGKVPNPLMKSVANAIEGKNNLGKTNDMNSDDDTLKIFEFMRTVAKSSLVSPTYDEIEECGVKLTDQQITAIFSIAMGDMQKTISFRGVPGDT